MIRRDYLVRMVQEMTQALARILFLKKAQDYPQAVEEIERVLSRFWKLSLDQIRSFTVEQWIEQCRGEEGPMGEKLVALADLMREQAELHTLQENPRAGGRSAGVALGLYLEAVSSPGSIVSTELLAKIARGIEETAGFSLERGVFKRLLAYYETRAMLSKAEDLLFERLESGEPGAVAEGLEFYQRLGRRSDQELDQGGLPRKELQEGIEEVRKRFLPSPVRRERDQG